MLFRPVTVVCGGNEGAAGESGEGTREVCVGSDVSGGDNRVVAGDADHAAVEGPVAKLAKGHAVADIGILAHRPRHDVRRIDGGVLIGGDDPHPAQGAAMVVRSDDHAAEALPPRRLPEVLRLRSSFLRRQL